MKTLRSHKIVAVLLAICFISISKGQSTLSASPTYRKILYGQASYYGKGFHGKKTANGEIFNKNGFTAACNSLPLGTWVKVTNLRNKKTVVVKINDRLHKKMNRLLDLSQGAAEQLGYINSGLTRVKVEVLNKPQRAPNRK